MLLPLFALNIAFMFIAAFNSKFAFQSLIAALFVNLHSEYFVLVQTGGGPPWGPGGLPGAGSIGLQSEAYVFLAFYVASLVAAYMRG